MGQVGAVCVWSSFLGEGNSLSTGMWLGIIGPVELDIRLLCQEVFVGEEAMKVGGDQAREIPYALYLKMSHFEL